jgi:hypothetical protein
MLVSEVSSPITVNTGSATLVRQLCAAYKATEEGGSVLGPLLAGLAGETSGSYHDAGVADAHRRGYHEQRCLAVVELWRKRFPGVYPEREPSNTKSARVCHIIVSPRRNT